MERIGYHIFCIFKQSHPFSRAYGDLAVTFQKTHQWERNIHDTVTCFIMESAGKIYNFLIDSKLVNQNVLFLIFWLHKKLVPFFSGEKKSGVADNFRPFLGKIFYNISTVIFTDQNFIKVR